MRSRHEALQEEGDRVVVYHISGCGLCNDCRRGYMISCTSPLRAAYGWQRDGGMAPYMLAEEKDCVYLPGSLTYTDGAQVACGFGTVYEALEKIGISGDHSVLVTGLGPVGLATLMIAKAMGAERLIGVDTVKERCAIAKEKKIADAVLVYGPDTLKSVLDLTGGKGVERAIDSSGHADGRSLAVRAVRKWGRIAFVGEGGTVELNPSADIIHDQKTIYGSWVTSIWLMEEIVEQLVRWNIHPEDTVDIEDPVIVKIAQHHGIYPALVCIKWAIQRGQIPIPLSVTPSKILSNLKAAVSDPLSQEEMREIATIDKNCRLVKGQVFLWKPGQTWEDLWDLSGEITPG